ncbi:hypothetical protein F5Y00DRAFT_233831 [Daldinia vernicosa]|uniref:uncharacterized protein n=1 Tax=Daldinia vernicosa TaxID=114800 RepID=UPI0020089F34|nr:uncharacterized protein F5Y00DRAFT_233831 [Daldinia vernicosa]KAI0850184.1 hypothetical protein F5Y00DRAFT_233831 [Daldinia vernicosa]
MAPTSTSTSKAAPTGNPAPDFTVTMNRIQTQLEARMKAARAFLPSRSDLNNASSSSSSSSSGSGSFSALGGSSSTSNPQTQSRDAAARRAAEEAEFAEERGLDPNAGIGLTRGPATGNENTSGTDRDTARLRGRLLGKRGRNGAGTDGQQKWVRKEDSSDEEAGRSGLGRAKRSGKRSRAEMETQQQSSDHVESAIPSEQGADMNGTKAQVSHTNSPKDGTETLVAEPSAAPEIEPNQPPSEESPKKKRKRKKKKKARDGTGTGGE